MKYIRKIKKLHKTNYGRQSNWIIEFEGEVVGVLTDFIWEDMFWFSYKVVSVDEGKNEILFHPENWQEQRFRFKNKDFSEYAPQAFCGGISPYIINDRISMRGLCVSSTKFEDICLEVLSWFSK